MQTLVITPEIKSFIDFCIKNSDVINLVKIQDSGLKAVHELTCRLETFAKEYVMRERKEIAFWNGPVQKTLIANKIVEGL